MVRVRRTKVRERLPKDLDAALLVALQLEVWSVDQSTQKERRTREIVKLEKKDEQTDVFKKEVAKIQKQLLELQEKDQTATLTKRVTELEAHLTQAKSSTATAPASNTALPLEQLNRRKKAPVGDAEIPVTGSGPARKSPTLRKESWIVAESVRFPSCMHHRQERRKTPFQRRWAQ